MKDLQALSWMCVELFFFPPLFTNTVMKYAFPGEGRSTQEAVFPMLDGPIGILGGIGFPDEHSISKLSALPAGLDHIALTVVVVVGCVS